MLALLRRASVSCRWAPWSSAGWRVSRRERALRGRGSSPNRSLRDTLQQHVVEEELRLAVSVHGRDLAAPLGCYRRRQVVVRCERVSGRRDEAPGPPPPIALVLRLDANSKERPRARENAS